MKTRTLLMILVPAAVLLLLGFSALRQKQWNNSHFAGEVVALSDTSMTITDVRTGTRTVHLSPTVEIRKGPEREKGELRLGDRVIVVGALEGGVIEPEVIRIFDAPKER